MSTTIPELFSKSFSDKTTNAEAFEEAISFLYLGIKANAIESFDANLISSTKDILIAVSYTHLTLPTILLV